MQESTPPLSTVLPPYEDMIRDLETSRKFYTKKHSLILEEERLRSTVEALVVLKALEAIHSDLLKCFTEYNGLESLFDKEFMEFRKFVNKEFILDVCFVEDYIFPMRKLFPIVVNEVFDVNMVESYKQTFKDWIVVKVEEHTKTQDFILTNFSIRAPQKSMDCQCLKCLADYRSKLRDFTISEARGVTDQMELDLKTALDTETIEQISYRFFELKKRIDKLIHDVRYKFRRGTLNKIENQLKQMLLEKFSPKTELSQNYIQVLRIFCLDQLRAADLSDELITPQEFERFFQQLGLNIWKSERFIEKEFSRLIRSVLVLKRKDISSNILQEYLGQFWLHAEARKLKRKIFYHMGPTNSGKTFHAVESLIKAKSGCYLAPLRLLASELYDTLNSKGVPTTLLTGEEVIETTEATHFSSTIEMARFHERFKCCVIDEIQMISDPQRGWAWTRALINICADEIHICGDNTVLDLVNKIIQLTGDELEVIQYKRLTKLEIEPGAITLGELQRGDALIVFSRKNALKYKSDLERLGLKVSIVYGRLSPEVRREQARKFDSGETDVIVSTDAISMGMNLPIRRIVFSTLTKHINSKEYDISDSEIKQISGRAGRFGRYPTGHVTCLTRCEDGIDKITAALETDLEQNTKAMVGPDLEIFDRVNHALSDSGLAVLDLSEFLRLFNTMVFKDPFYCVDLSEMIEIAEMVEEANREKNTMNSAEIFGFTCAPVNLGLMEHVQYFVFILNNFVLEKNINNEYIDYHSDNIDYLETTIKCVELYQWLARHFDNKHFEFEENELLQNKSHAIEKLNQLLSEKLVRNCSSCGVKLDDQFKFNICETCFKSRNFNARRGPPRRDGGRDGAHREGGSREGADRARHSGGGSGPRKGGGGGDSRRGPAPQGGGAGRGGRSNKKRNSSRFRR